MRALALVLASLATFAIPAFAQNEPTGISGFVLDADTQKPLTGAQVSVYRMPLSKSMLAAKTIQTDSRGFFADINLEPGRYVVMTSAEGLRAACVTSDLSRGAVTRITVKMSRSHEVCIGKNVQSAIIAPGQTADVYIVH